VFLSSIFKSWILNTNSSSTPCLAPRCYELWVIPVGKVCRDDGNFGKVFTSGFKTSERDWNTGESWTGWTGWTLGGRQSPWGRRFGMGPTSRPPVLPWTLPASTEDQSSSWWCNSSGCFPAEESNKQLSSIKMLKTHPPTGYTHIYISI